MKKYLFAICAVVAALSASAASLSFVKVGSTYKVNFLGCRPQMLTVLVNDGDGWFHCLDSDADVSHINFAQALSIEEVDPKPTLQPGSSTDWVHKAILDNLRQLMASFDQHCLEKGTDRARLSDLVGPDKYMRKIESVAGEDYRKVVFRQGKPLVVTTPGGKVVIYP